MVVSHLCAVLALVCPSALAESSVALFTPPQSATTVTFTIDHMGLPPLPRPSSGWNTVQRDASSLPEVKHRIPLTGSVPNPHGDVTLLLLQAAQVPLSVRKRAFTLLGHRNVAFSFFL